MATMRYEQAALVEIRDSMAEPSEAQNARFLAAHELIRGYMYKEKRAPLAERMALLKKEKTPKTDGVYAQATRAQDSFFMASPAIEVKDSVLKVPMSMADHIPPRSATSDSESVPEIADYDKLLDQFDALTGRKPETREAVPNTDSLSVPDDAATTDITDAVQASRHSEAHQHEQNTAQPSSIDAGEVSSISNYKNTLQSRAAESLRNVPNTAQPSSVGVGESSSNSIYESALQSQFGESVQHVPNAPCAAFNSGKCSNSNCKKSHAPDDFSIQLLPGHPNLCKSFLIYHMSCENASCPYSHDLQACGMPLDRPSLFPSILAEYRVSHGALQHRNTRIEALLNNTHKYSIFMTDNDIQQRLMARDKKAVVFSPMGPVICKAHLMDKKGCNTTLCPYSHDLSPLGLTLRSKEEALKLFESIKSYWNWGSATVSNKVFLYQIAGMEPEKNQLLRGFTGSEILGFLKSDAKSLIEARDLAIAKESGKSRRARNESNEAADWVAGNIPPPRVEPAVIKKVSALDNKIIEMADALAQAIDIEGIAGEDILRLINRRRIKLEKRAAAAEKKEQEELNLRRLLGDDWVNTVLVPDKKVANSKPNVVVDNTMGVLGSMLNPTAPAFTKASETMFSSKAEEDKENKASKSESDWSVHEAEPPKKPLPKFFKPRQPKLKTSYRDGEIVGAGAPELGEGNIGLAMLQKMGWKKGEGLGKNGEGGESKNLLPIEMRVKRDNKGIE